MAERRVSVTVDLGTALALVEATNPAAVQAKIKAFNTTSDAVKVAEKAEIGRVFKEPVGWTVNAPFRKGATLQDQTARTWLKDETVGRSTPAGKYLLPQIQGGPRPQKPFERKMVALGILRPGEVTVPFPAILNTKKNINVSLLRAALRQVSAATTPTRRRSNSTRYFVLRLAGSGSGLYRGTDDRIDLLLLFVPASTSYRPIYDFHRVSDPVITRTLMPTWEAEFDRRMAQAR